MTTPITPASMEAASVAPAIARLAALLERQWWLYGDAIAKCEDTWALVDALTIAEARVRVRDARNRYADGYRIESAVTPTIGAQYQPGNIDITFTIDDGEGQIVRVRVRPADSDRGTHEHTVEVLA